MRNHRFIVGKGGIHRDSSTRFIKCCGCWQCTIVFNREKIQYLEHTKLLKPTSYSRNTLRSRYQKQQCRLKSNLVYMISVMSWLFSFLLFSNSLFLLNCYGTVTLNKGKENLISKFKNELQHTVKFRKEAPPCISPQTRNAKNPPINRPSEYKTISEYKPPGACTQKLSSNSK